MPHQLPATSKLIINPHDIMFTPSHHKCALPSLPMASAIVMAAQSVRTASLGCERAVHVFSKASPVRKI